MVRTPPPGGTTSGKGRGAAMPASPADVRSPAGHGRSAAMPAHPVVQPENPLANHKSKEATPSLAEARPKSGTSFALPTGHNPPISGREDANVAPLPDDYNLDEAAVHQPHNQLEQDAEALGAVGANSYADVYDDDDEVAAQVNAPEAEYKYLVIQCRSVANSLGRFDPANYVTVGDIVNSLSNACLHLRNVSFTVVIGTEDRFFPILRDYQGLNGIREIVDKFVPNFKLVVQAFLRNPTVHEGDKDIIMAHFKIVEVYQRVSCMVLRDLIDQRGLDMSYGEVQSVVSTTASATSVTYTDERQSFQMRVYKWVQDTAYLHRRIILGEITRTVFETDLVTMEDTRKQLEDIHLRNLIEVWKTKRQRQSAKQPASACMTSAPSGAATSTTAPRPTTGGYRLPSPSLVASAVAEQPVSANPTLAELSQSAQNVTGMAEIVVLSKNLLQMQINSLNQNMSWSNEYSEYKDSDLPGSKKVDFYASLPPPWNVQPDTVGKYSDEFSRMTKFIKDAGNDGERLVKFDGDENKYFVWRPLVITGIHQRNLSLKDKYNTLMRTLKRDSDALIDGLLGITDPTPENYKNLIELLETNYGGPDRAYNHAMEKIRKLKKFDPDNFNTVSEYYGAITEFINFCLKNSLPHCVNPGQMANTILKVLLDTDQITGMLDYCGSHDINQSPGSLFQVQGYLKSIMGATSHAWAMVGYQRKPSKQGKSQHKYGFSPTKQKRRTYCLAAQCGKDNESDSYVSESTTDDDTNSSNKSNSIDYYSIDNVYYHDGNDSSSEHSQSKESSDPSSITSPVQDGEIVNDRQLREMQLQKLDFIECELCKPEKHLLFTCPKFLDMSLRRRFDFVEQTRRCYNCLGIGHGTRICIIDNRCQVCNRKHHTLLCKENAKSEKDKSFISKYLAMDRSNYDSEGKSRPVWFGNRRQSSSLRTKRFSSSKSSSLSTKKVHSLRKT